MPFGGDGVEDTSRASCVRVGNRHQPRGAFVETRRTFNYHRQEGTTPTQVAGRREQRSPAVPVGQQVGQQRSAGTHPGSALVLSVNRLPVNRLSVSCPRTRAAVPVRGY